MYRPSMDVIDERGELFVGLAVWWLSWAFVTSHSKASFSHYLSESACVQVQSRLRFVLLACIGCAIQALYTSHGAYLLWSMPLVPLLHSLITGYRDIRTKLPLFTDYAALSQGAGRRLAIVSVLQGVWAIMFLLSGDNLHASLVSGMTFASLVAAFVAVGNGSLSTRDEDSDRRLGGWLFHIPPSFWKSALLSGSIVSVIHLVYRTSLWPLAGTLLGAAQICGITTIYTPGSDSILSAAASASATGIILMEGLTVHSALAAFTYAHTALYVFENLRSSPLAKRVHLLIWVFIPSLALAFLFAHVHDYEGYIPHLPNRPAYLATHPIDKLHQQQTELFQQTLAAQSKTFDDAVNEYRRRYQRAPPPGFQNWYDIAKENDFALIDEFDTIMASLEPFWSVDSQVLRERVENVVKDKGVVALITLDVNDSRAVSNEPDHGYAKMFVEMASKYADRGVLPSDSVRFFINTLDEPRLMRSAGSVSTPPSTDNKVAWHVYNHSPIGARIFADCPNYVNFSSGENAPPAIDHQHVDLEKLFIVRSSTSPALCDNMAEATQHGFFQSPMSMYATHDLVPVLSQCAPIGFGDIPYPSPWYFWEDREKSPQDVAWDDKLGQLYWAGSSTGSYNDDDTWLHGHRVHLAMMANPPPPHPPSMPPSVTMPSWSEPALLFNSSSSTQSHWQAFPAHWSDIKSYFDVKVKRIVQCDDTACEAMRLALAFPDSSANNTEGIDTGRDPAIVKGPLSQPLDKWYTALKSKYVLDIDGNSFSGRYHRLLASSSCVVKMTVFKEWSDDFLFPWVHYVPAGFTLAELPETMRYLVEEQRGDEIGAAIAREGEAWAKKVLRNVDMEIVLLRILMELGRVLDPDRDGQS